MINERHVASYILLLQVTTKHYLVKWRSLPYEDCTWELEADVDPKKIEDFK